VHTITVVTRASGTTLETRAFEGSAPRCPRKGTGVIRGGAPDARAIATWLSGLVK
jgi:hypothetical protein